MEWNFQQGLDDLTLALVIGLSILISYWILENAIKVINYIRFRIKIKREIDKSYKLRSRYPQKPSKNKK